jgi:hypothetical protein
MEITVVMVVLLTLHMNTLEITTVKNSIFSILISSGIDTNASYPYTGNDGNCSYIAKGKGATIDSYVNVDPTDDAFTKALVINPVGTAVMVTDDFQVNFELTSEITIKSLTHLVFLMILLARHQKYHME